MKLKEAQSIIREVQGKSYTWLEAWGLSTIKEAIRVIYNRKSSTDADIEYAEGIERKLYREW